MAKAHQMEWTQGLFLWEFQPKEMKVQKAYGKCLENYEM